MRLWVAASLLLCAGGATVHASPDGLIAAERAYQELRYEEAWRELERALITPLSREELLRLYELRGQVASILEGPDAGEREFRALLVLDPQHRLPARASPVIRVPHERAARWVRDHGHLAVQHVPPVDPRVDRPVVLEVRALSDPLGMVAGVRVAWRGEGGPRSLVRDGLRFGLPPQPAGPLRYHIEVLDSTGHVLLRLGSEQAPLSVVVGIPGAEVALSPAQASGGAGSHSPLRRYALGAGVVAGASLLGGIGFDYAAFREYGALERRCAPRCQPDDLTTLNRREDMAVLLYAAAATGAVTAAILFAVDRLRD